MLNEFSATIEKFYAAAADPSLWGAALRAMEDYTGSTGAVLNLVPRTPTGKPGCLAGSFSESDCAEYAENYMWRCPRIAFGESHPHVRIHFDRMILSEAEMDRDATYEWFGKHGLRYYVAGWIGGSSTHRAYMSLQRSRRQGHVEPEHVEQFALLLKHMEQALSLAIRLGTLEQEYRLNLALINSIAQAVFTFDHVGKVLQTNSKADRLLAAGDGVVLFDGKLRCRINSQQAAFDRLLEAALNGEGTEPRGGWMRIHCTTGRRPLIALVAPIVAAESLFGPPKTRALVIVSDPADVALVGDEALQDLFGLSFAEARLANALARGHSIESAAMLLAIQPATARSELKSVFRKIGVNRQQDLVRLLTSLAMTPDVHA